MIDRQERDLRRDGLRFVLGVGSLALVELLVPTGPTTAMQLVHGFLTGASIALLLSGIFRATDEQLVTSMLAFGVGFAVSAVIDLF